MANYANAPPYNSYGHSMPTSVPPVYQQPTYVQPQQFQAHPNGIPASPTAYQQNAGISFEQFQTMTAQNPKFASFLNQFQGNSLPPPPFPPPLVNGYPVPPPIPPPPLHASPSFPQTRLPQPTTAGSPPEGIYAGLRVPELSPTHNRAVEMIDIDKEEGELSEPDKGTSIRTANQHNVAKSTATSTFQPSRIGAEMASESHVSPALRTAIPSTQVKTAISQRERAKSFLALLNQNKIGYTQLVRDEGLSAPILKDLYHELGIPIPIEQTVAPIAKSTSTVQVAVKSLSPGPKRKQPPTSPTIQVSSKTGSVPKPTTQAKGAPTAADRQDYIARLMAARSAKQASSVKVGSPLSNATTSSTSKPQSPKITNMKQDTSLQTQSSKTTERSTQESPAPVNTPKQEEEEAVRRAAEKKRLQTELARKRIEMLTAARAKKSKEAASNEAPIKPIEMATPSIPVSISSAPTPQSDTSFYDEESAAEITPAYAREQRLSSSREMSVVAASSNLHHGTVQVEPRLSEQPGSFPGLKLGSQASPGHGTPVGGQSQSASRKRPVASDFDMDPVTSTYQPKRPFGTSKFPSSHERVVIEVSDDDSDGSAMDLDDDDDEVPTPSRGYGRNGQDSSFVGNLQSTGSRMSSLPQSAINTPPAAQTPTSAKDARILNAKEQQIQDLRRKIAEMEQKAAAKRRVQVPCASSATTPSTDMTANPIDNSSFAIGSNTGEERSSITGRTPHVLQPAVPSSPLGHASQAGSDWKAKRRAEIQAGIPVLDATLSGNKTRLEQLRLEMEQLQMENQRRLEDKKRLIQELEGLGIDTKGVPHEELKAKKAEIEIEQANAVDETKLIATPESHYSDNMASIQTGDTATQLSGEAEQIARSMNDLPGVAQTVKEALVEKEERPCHDDEAPNADEGTKTSGGQESSDDISDDAMDFSPYGSEAGDMDEARQPALLATSTSLQNQYSDLGTGIDSPSVSESVAVDDQDDFYSPEPVAIEDQKGKVAERIGSPLKQVGSQPVREDPSPVSSEYEMEDSEAMYEQSDDYDPADVETMPSHVSVHSSSAQSDNEDANIDGKEDEQEEGEFEEEHESGLTDLNESPSRELTSDIASPYSVSISASDHPPSISDGHNDESSPANGPVTEVNGAESRSVPQIVETIAVERSDPPPQLLNRSHYTPYESPLRLFKSYRYHPKYSEHVPGGVRSLTYSHQINPDNPICRYEAAGGVCNDEQCPDQHFRKMGLSGDMVLVQLGTANPGKTAEEKVHWATGLRDVLKELREKNTKDPDVVAAAIADYRRAFLRDPSRVLNI